MPKFTIIHPAMVYYVCVVEAEDRDDAADMTLTGNPLLADPIEYDWLPEPFVTDEMLDVNGGDHVFEGDVYAQYVAREANKEEA